MGEHKVADKARRALELRLLDGSWTAGTRLPPERDLAEALGVSRASLREAVSSLKARGMLESRRGSGVFVTERLQANIVSPWRQLVAEHPDLRWDTLEFRRELEGAAAYYAAIRATEDDLARIEAVFARLCDAYDTGERAAEMRADADFHEAIAEASHNSMFRFLHAGIVRMLREHISLNLIGMHDATAGLREQHQAIWDAIRLGQPDNAREAMQVHMDFTRSELVRHAGKSADMREAEA
ncbi:FadR/GntR family transcriptional regulator [Noviherbaspirillum denitrificans]|uniref:Pyruvate dehydrogenase complex repressor n=1 Tax=Noviherbaspirillum denitrificans TaxID=1968433 RepID=A0A254TBA4_9BURK|nr:FadR/GntR family transcriptional regulator [Noviherbaspirillum denitrificans]OWW19929.1 GntR family transcriptional regulator [Noviherbaspirillum denitrificans]